MSPTDVAKTGTDRLLAALRSPAAYRHTVDNVQILETHISWIVLTGPYAYKLKKPVALGFLDFSTLERRRLYCQEEVRLNQRLAPELYLGVVPIIGPFDAPTVDGEGGPVEYAVRMRQFPQDALLSRVLRRQLLTPAHVDELAVEIAQFHERIPAAPATSSFGGLDHVWKCVADNFAQLSADIDHQDEIERLREWSAQAFRQGHDAFIARQQQGSIRECHGDMHLGNMLLLDGRIVIFDCIEFNEAFRWIDVLSETAFTVMDLDDRGQPAYAHRLLNSYLEQTGDYAGLAVLRYYLVYRALVRAKVASIRLSQTNADSPQRSGLLAEYRGYLDLATRYTRPERPLLIVTHGPSGSGKTTLTQPILEALGAVRIRSDVERKRLAGLKPLQRSSANGTDIYSAESTARTYERLAALARSVMEAGFSVIVDATFLKHRDRAVFQQLASQRGIPYAILDFQASEQQLRERVERRRVSGHDASEADVAVLAGQLAAAEPLDESGRQLVIALNSENPQTVTMAIDSLSRLRSKYG